MFRLFMILNMDGFQINNKYDFEFSVYEARIICAGFFICLYSRAGGTEENEFFWIFWNFLGWVIGFEFERE